MNILHMKYAVEVARLGSLNKAAETLRIAQPNISRSIKELEADLGILLFRRSAKGMRLTPEGEEFMSRARDVLSHMDQLEQIYRSGAHKKRRFSVCAPRACYVAAAVAAFSRRVERDVEIRYREGDAAYALEGVPGNECRLGIVRYEARCEKQYGALREEKGLVGELVAEYAPVLLLSRAHPLAGVEQIGRAALAPYTEIAYPEPCVLPPSASRAPREGAGDTVGRILVYERASALELLAGNPDAFLWASPVPQSTLERYGLVQRPCAEGGLWRDVLVRRRDYEPTETDRAFLAALNGMKAEVLGPTEDISK